MLANSLVVFANTEQLCFIHRKVERELVSILALKHKECHQFHWHDAEERCYDIDQEWQLAERNFFIKCKTSICGVF